MVFLAAQIEVKGELEDIISKATEVFKAEGFGALARQMKNMDSKIESMLKKIAE